MRTTGFAHADNGLAHADNGLAHADNGLARADLVRSRDLHAKVFLGV
jgi:hypothetical protein